MSRYIDADKLNKALGDEIKKLDKQFYFPDITKKDYIHIGITRAITSVNNQPTEDVQEVVHGKWEDFRKGYGWKCSQCGNIAFTDSHNYCPNCGAKMDEE
jgi:rubrerythrin